jgi:hypothetical protein
MRPPIHLNDIDLGVLFANMAQKEHLENVRKYIQPRLPIHQNCLKLKHQIRNIFSLIEIIMLLL